MYDRSETKAANDRFWHLIRTNLGYGPENLTRGADLWAIWQAPDLVLAQTCGLPYRTRLHGKVTLIATPDYGLPDCAPGMYCSVFVARRDDPRKTLTAFANARFAYNDALSQSGWAAPQSFAHKNGFRFENIVQSGAHQASARLVASGGADIAALDALSWEMMREWDEFAGALQVLAKTTPTPALPFIAAPGANKAKVFAALSAAICGLSAPDRKALHLKNLVDISADTYLSVPTPPGP